MMRLYLFAFLRYINITLIKLICSTSTLIFFSHSPVAVFQIVTALACNPDATRHPSRDMLIELSGSIYDKNFLHSPVVTFHIRIVKSRDLDIILLLSSDIATELTFNECPSNVFKHAPVLKSHIRTVASYDPDTMKLLSRDIATEPIQFL